MKTLKFLYILVLLYFILIFIVTSTINLLLLIGIILNRIALILITNNESIRGKINKIDQLIGFLIKLPYRTVRLIWRIAISPLNIFMYIAWGIEYYYKPVFIQHEYHANTVFVIIVVLCLSTAYNIFSMVKGWWGKKAKRS